MSLLDSLTSQPEAPDPKLPEFNPKSLSISPAGVKYGNKELKAKHITGVRFHSKLEEKTVEKQGFGSKRVWTFKYMKGTLEFLDMADNQIRVNIYARDETQYGYFVNAVNDTFRFIVPVLLKNLAVQMHHGKLIKIGQLSLNKNRIRFQKGWIFRKFYTFPYDDLQVICENDEVRFTASNDTKVRGTMNAGTTWNAVILDQLVELMQKLPEEGESIEDIVPPQVLEVKAAPVEDTLDDGKPIQLLDIAIRGPIAVPRANYQVRHKIRLIDVTDGQDSPMPVLCSITDLQMPDSILFEFVSSPVPIPYETAVMSKWLSLVSVPKGSLVFPRKGRRKMLVESEIVSDETGEVMDHCQCRISYTNEEPGYIDLEENRDRVEELTLILAIEVSAIDGTLQEQEGAIVQEWIRKQVNSADESEQYGKKQHLNRVVQETVQMLESTEARSVSSIRKELAEIATAAQRYSVVQLCKQIVEADEFATREEFDFLKSLAETFEVDLGQITVVGEDPGEPLGLTEDMTESEQLKHLNKQFRTWSSRVNHKDKRTRERAKRMVKLIEQERTRLKQYHDAPSKG